MCPGSGRWIEIVLVLVPVDVVVPVSDARRDEAFVIVESSPPLSEKPIAIPATTAAPSRASAGPFHLTGRDSSGI
jgi:hypothetical protein